MKKILVPTDFSPNAERAIDYAVRIAKLNAATVILVHACEHLENIGLEAGLSRAEANKRIADDAFDKLELLKKSIEQAEKVSVNIQLYRGPIVDTILVAGEEHKADLIIMGTMGITGLRDKIFGTVTATVIGKATVPVLAIPLEYDWSTPAKFLLAINNFEEAGDILHPFFDMARVFGAEVRIAVFTDDDKTSAVDFISDERSIRLAEERLEAKFPGMDIKTEHLSGRHFEDSINEYIETNKIDVLAMTTHKTSFPGNLFHRTMARKMSYHTKVPLLAIPV